MVDSTFHRSSLTLYNIRELFIIEGPGLEGGVGRGQRRVSNFGGSSGYLTPAGPDWSKSRPTRHGERLCVSRSNFLSFE